MATTDTAELVERALQYAREHGAQPSELIYAITYDEERIVFLGDGWFQIGQLQRDGWQGSVYPIRFNPNTGQLRVKVPRHQEH